MTWNNLLARRPVGGAHQAARETSRMRSVRWLTLFASAAVLVGISGCSRNQYDEQIDYPVRTDLLVTKPAQWGDIVPTGFNRPGILPLDALRLPENERPPDAAKLQGLLGKG